MLSQAYLKFRKKYVAQSIFYNKVLNISCFFFKYCIESKKYLLANIVKPEHQVSWACWYMHLGTESGESPQVRGQPGLRNKSQETQ